MSQPLPAAPAASARHDAPTAPQTADRTATRSATRRARRALPSAARWLLAASLALPLLLMVACAPAGSDTGGDGDGDVPAAPAGDETLVLGAIPDQDPEVLQRRFGELADYLSAELDVPVEYRPVTDYAAAVTAFRNGDLDLVWFGGLTGVQARLQTPGARAIVQRDIDPDFRSVFIASADSGIEPFDELEGLQSLAGRRFTFGSESSTSGRLMPQHFLAEAGVSPEDFDGEPGFSGAHDATIQLVEAGSYEAGALNEAVWDERRAAGEVDESRVIELWRTPPYPDYHWVLRPDAEERFGEGFAERVQAAFLALSAENPAQAEILDMFSAGAFIPTSDEEYAEIEAVGREIGKIQ